MNKNLNQRMTAQSFEDVTAWKKAHQFVLSVYRLTEGFPQKEIYGLTAQFRRAATSVPANIAEGFKKTGVADKLRFYNIAQGSLEECRYYLILTRDLNYGQVEPLVLQLEEASKLLNAYAGAIKRKTLLGGAAILALLTIVCCLVA
jgi:four helix bundle protein